MLVLLELSCVGFPNWGLLLMRGKGHFKECRNGVRYHLCGGSGLLKESCLITLPKLIPPSKFQPSHAKVFLEYIGGVGCPMVLLELDRVILGRFTYFHNKAVVEVTNLEEGEGCWTLWHPCLLKLGS